MRDTNLTTEMNAMQIADALQTLIDIKQPAFIWGPPGVGKSQVVRQVADSLGYGFIDQRASQMDPVDLRGLPTIVDGQTQWAIPSFLPNVARDGEKGVLLLDEVNTAPNLVLAALYQLILDRALGDYVLPDGWVVLAAGNRESDKGVTTRMPSPLANRFVHLNFGIDVDVWSRWAIGAGIETEVIAFMRFRPELLHVFDPNSGEKAFPSPRSWEFVSSIVRGAPSADVELALLAGTIGQAAAIEFTGFLRVFRQLPSPDAVLMDPLNAHVPTDPATMYALTGALARKATANNFDQIKQYAERIPVENQVCLVRDAVNNDADIQSTRPYIEWASNNSDVFA